MIIHNLDFVRAIVTPHETDTPLLIDPDAVLPCAVSMQRFQAITGQARQVYETRGTLEDLQEVSVSDCGMRKNIRFDAERGQNPHGVSGLFQASEQHHSCYGHVSIPLSSSAVDTASLPINHCLIGTMTLSPA